MAQFGKHPYVSYHLKTRHAFLLLTPVSNLSRYVDLDRNLRYSLLWHMVFSLPANE
jgi:hypothetical protein